MIKQKEYLIEKINFSDISKFSNRVITYLETKRKQYIKDRHLRSFIVYNSIFYLMGLSSIRYYYKTFRYNFIEGDKNYLNDFSTCLGYYYLIYKNDMKSCIKDIDSFESLMRHITEINSYTDKNEIRAFRKFYLQELLNQKERRE